MLHFIRFIILLIFTVILTAQQQIPITSTSTLAINYFKKGLQFEDQNKLDDALINYVSAVQYDSTFALGYMKIAMMKGSFSDKREFMALAMKYHQLASIGEQLWIKGRDAFYGTGNRKQEYSFFQKLVVLFPTDEKANYLFGFVNHHHGKSNTDLAIQYLKKAIEINPDYLTARIDLAYAFIEANKPKKAERLLAETLVKYPFHIDLLDSYAELLLGQLRFNESVEMYNRALKINPKNPWSVFGKATNLNILGKGVQARLLLDELDFFQLGERDQRHLMLAYVCSFLFEGDLSSAIKIYQKFGNLAFQNRRMTQAFVSKRDIIRYYYEIGQTKDAMIKYNEFLEYVNTELKNDRIKLQVKNLKLYYQALEQFTEKRYSESNVLLDQFILLNKQTDLKATILKARIHIAKQEYLIAKNLIRNLEKDDPAVSYWLGIVEDKLGNLEQAKGHFLQLSKQIEIHDVYLAFYRHLALKKLRELSS